MLFEVNKGFFIFSQLPLALPLRHSRVDSGSTVGDNLRDGFFIRQNDSAHIAI